MNISTLVARHIAEVIQGNWTEMYLGDVVSDVTYQEAVIAPAGLTNSIAMLLYHIGFYNNVVIERIKGINPVINDANGFDITINNEEEWQALKAASLDSFGKLAKMVAVLPDEDLWALTPTGTDSFYKTLHGIAEHAHYHLGQIVLIKRLIRQQII